MYKSAFFCYFSSIPIYGGCDNFAMYKFNQKSNIEDEIDCCIYHTLLLLAGFGTR